jgi:anti-sigma B factor antagonist
VLKINKRTLGKFHCIAVEGEIDMCVSPEVREVLQSAFKDSPGGVLVDLSGVPYMDSSGIATLVEGMQWSKRESAHFMLVGLQEKVMNTLKLARLNELFEIYPTAQEALKSLTS